MTVGDLRRAATAALVVATLSAAELVSAPSDSFTCSRTTRGNGGFNLVCDPGTTTPDDQRDFRIQNVRKYDATIDDADWVYYSVRANRDLESFQMDTRWHYSDGSFSDCTERIPELDAAEVSEETMIPDICARDEEWSAVEFLEPRGKTCGGCTRYEIGDLPEDSSLTVGSTSDPLELDRQVEELEAGYRRRMTR